MTDPHADDLHARLDEAGEEHLEKLRAGQPPEPHACDGEPNSKDPELARALVKRLRLIERLHRVGQVLSTHGSAASHVRPRCPHCGHLASPEPAAPEGSGPHEITCSSCGSRFRLSHEQYSARAQSGIPDVIGRFKVLHLLGRGAFGSVFKARDPDLDRWVAVKVPRASCFGTKAEEERFLREARSAAGLRHPGIVQVYEVGEQDGIPFIVSEYVESRTLAELIAECRPGFRESANLLAAIAEALHHAHVQGIVHRDIKPGNILIDPEGRPHISDFGLARRDDEEVTITMDGQILGTPAYMSPEQARGDQENVEARSDQYGLGVILYELLTGERPFRGAKSMLLEQVLKDEPRPPRQLNDHVPVDLETICLKAMAKEPARRYATSGALAEDLGRYLRHEPIHARPTGRVERAARWARRNPQTAVLSAAIFALLAAISVVSTTMAFRVDNARGEAQARLSRLNVSTGFQKLMEGDVLGALPWFAEAYRMDEGHAERMRMHDTRIESTLLEAPKLTHMAFHPDPVWRLRFTRGGKELAVVSDSRVSVIDLTSGKVERAELRKDPKVRLLAVSEDGRTVQTLEADGGIRVWKPFTGETVTTVRQEVEVHGGAIESRGRFFLATGADHGVRLWSLPGGEVICPPLQHDAKIAWTESDRSGSLMVTGTAQGETAVWKLPQGERLCNGPSHNGGIRFGSWSPDQQQIVTAGNDLLLKVWDSKTGELDISFSGFGNIITAARFSPDGRRLLGSSGDGTARAWDLSTGKLQFPVLRHGLGVNDAIFTPDQRRFVTVSNDGAARVWDAATGREVGTPFFHSSQVACLAVSPEGRRVATGGADGTARVWDLAPRGLLQAPIEFPAATASASLSPDGRLVASLCHPNKGSVHDVESGKLVRELQARPDGTRAIAWRPDSRALAVQKAVDLVTVVSVLPGEAAEPDLDFPGPKLALQMAFSPDGRRIGAASADGSVHVIDAVDGTREPLVLRLKSMATRVAFSRDGSVLAAGGYDGGIQCWRLDGEQPFVSLAAHTGAVISLSFSPDGSLLASAGDEPFGHVWGVATGKPVTPALGHSVALIQALFSPDGKLVMTTSHDGTARLWSIRTGELVVPELQQQGGILSAGFSPDGSLVVLASFSGTVSVWETATGLEVSPRLLHSRPLVFAGFAADNRTIVTVPQEGLGGTWTLPRRGRQASDLRLLAHLLAGRRVDALGGFLRLETDEVRRGWESLREKYPDDFSTSAEAIDRWHWAELQVCRDQGLWHGTELHAAALVERGHPRSEWLRHVRAVSQCSVGSFAEGALTFAQAEAVAPLNGWLMYEWMLALLFAGNEKEAVRVASLSGDRYKTVTSAPAADAVALCAASLPDGALEDYGIFLELARRAVRRQPRNPQYHRTLGAVLYRSGRHEEAIPELEKAVSLDGAGAQVWDSAFLAMASSRSGQDAAARVWLEKARAALEVLTSQRGTQPTWHAWRWTRTSVDLVREAEALLARRTGEPAGAEDR